MKVLVKTLITIFILLSLSHNAAAEQYYVTEVFKVTMRTGPGTNRKVIYMPSSGETLTMLEHAKEWSRVKAGNGKEGWVLTQYLTKKRPHSQVVKELTKKNKKLSSMLDKVKSENQALSGTREKLINLEKDYNTLKEKSSTFLVMEQKYNEAAKQLEKQKESIAKLKSQLKNEDMIWFLSGAGVLVVGIILGIGARKQKRSSLL